MDDMDANLRFRAKIALIIIVVVVIVLWILNGLVNMEPPFMLTPLQLTATSVMDANATVSARIEQTRAAETAAPP